MNINKHICLIAGVSSAFDTFQTGSTSAETHFDTIAYVKDLPNNHTARQVNYTVNICKSHTIYLCI